MVAGGFAGAVTTPLDVVKTRVMLEAKVGRTKGVGQILTATDGHAPGRSANKENTISISAIVRPPVVGHLPL